ncbi:hypothetical protein [Agaribacter marinus]|uniref:DUF4440 domain-containing protein n=1 Tax=Agaribacter marinus TaxID=1431249 RepID=A0AA37SX22_9ALTE|nr:hypothetical protein [Agaribacter marinus]GLR71383.1 hypothetical protein GCM10007852_22910 [Agaribacter marinus]
MDHPVIEQIHKADNVIVSEDFDSLIDIYTDDAILVIEPGRNAKGKIAIRKATYVFTKNAKGIWLCSVDNSYGHEIIRHNTKLQRSN